MYSGFVLRSVQIGDIRNIVFDEGRYRLMEAVVFRREEGSALISSQVARFRVQGETSFEEIQIKYRGRRAVKSRG